MGLRANNIEVKGDSVKGTSSTSSKTTSNVELSERELEFILVTIKNGLFKGEYVETLYNLTLKLQKHFVDLRSKNLNI